MSFTTFTVNSLMLRRALALLVAALVSGAPLAQSQDAALIADLDKIFDDPILRRALVGARVESLRDGRILYDRNGAKLVMPASNMKIFTLSVAAETLGWNATFQTHFEATGDLDDRGTLSGDLIVRGGGDPSIASQDFGAAPLFREWADALWRAGIRRVEGRLIGDDNAFDDEGIGAGWAWDYLTDGYAAPSGALSYNENVVVVRAWPGKAAGDPVRLEVTPPGHGLQVTARLTTAAAGTSPSISIARSSGSAALTIRGALPAGGAVTTRTTTIDNPTRFFVGGLLDAVAARGIVVRGGAWDIDDVKDPPATVNRRYIDHRESQPLTSLGAHFLKVSQNYYGEMLLKAIGRGSGGVGTADAGKRVVRDTVAGWGITPDAYVMYDGSGLSRYNYVTSEGIVSILKRMWNDEKHRGPFAAALPVGGQDGTLSGRMRGTALAGHVQAKTGSIANVRSLSGYLETASGEKLVFSIIANHFTVPSGQIDAIAERALLRIAR